MLNKVSARFLGNLITRYRVVAGKNHLCAFLDESVNSRPADPIGAASNEGYFALKSVCHRLSPLQVDGYYDAIVAASIALPRPCWRRVKSQIWGWARSSTRCIPLPYRFVRPLLRLA